MTEDPLLVPQEVISAFEAEIKKFDFSPWKSTVKSETSKVHVSFSLQGQWGSKNPGHRESIHKACKNFVEVSISHAQPLGGFLAIDPTGLHHTAESSKKVDIPISLGFDIEEQQRVHSSLLNRIRHADDLLAPGPQPESLLWSAKEAVFKSLKGPNQPALIRAFGIQQWSSRLNGPEGLHIWTFHTVVPLTCEGPQGNPQTPREVCGVAWTQGSIQFAAAACLKLEQ